VLRDDLPDAVAVTTGLANPKGEEVPLRRMRKEAQSALVDEVRHDRWLDLLIAMRQRRARRPVDSAGEITT
jgi:hypothetical protein